VLLFVFLLYNLQSGYKAGNKLKHDDGDHRGEIKRAKPGDNAAQGCQNRLSDSEQDESQHISWRWREPGQDSPENDGNGEHVAQNPDKVEQEPHYYLLPNSLAFSWAALTACASRLAKPPFSS
jgi:hypothetical protein